MTVQELIDALSKIKNKTNCVLKWDAEYPLVLEGSQYVFLDHNQEPVSTQELLNCLNTVKDKSKIIYQYFEERIEDIREVEEDVFETFIW